MGAPCLLGREFVESCVMTTCARHIRQKDFVALVVSPSIMADIGCRTANHVNPYVSFGHHRLDQRALASADLSEEAEVNGAQRLPRRKFLKLLLRGGYVNTCGFGFAQSPLDIFA